MSDYPVSPLILELEILGSLISNSVELDAIEIEIELIGSIALGEIIDAGAIDIEVSIDSAEINIQHKKTNWVKWSEIGFLDFTITQTNVAGERPLDWSGTVYDLIKLDKLIVAYGSNGVSLLSPLEKIWGLKTISKIGSKCKGAAVGTDDEHYFVDRKDRLCKLSGQGLEILDYSEYLSAMTNPKLSLDIEYGVLYICDGTYGFVYSTRDKSFGSGPVNVTGIGTKDGTLYVIAPEEIEIPKFEICTDVYDLGTRRTKTIQNIEVGTDLTENLEAMVECRLDNKNNPGTVSIDNFRKTPWQLVNPNGIAYTPCHGIEFRFRFRSLIYEYFELDYLKINGVVHGAGYLDYSR
jgi:hypothetical protein